MVKGDANDVCQTFYNVGTAGENEEITLADIKVSGYQTESPDVMEGLTISFINGSGITETEIIEGQEYLREYVWQDWDGYYPAGWYDNAGGMLTTPEKIAEYQAQGLEHMYQSYFGDASTVKFKHGRGFRARPNPSYVDYDFELNFSGELHQGQMLIKDFVKGAANSCGNCTPVEIDLSQIVVGGYQTESPDVMEGLTISFINGSGITETEIIDGQEYLREYVWQDWDGYYPAGWYDNAGGMLTTPEKIAEYQAQGLEHMYQSYFGDATTVKFPAMQGFRARPNPSYTDYNFTITLPSPMGK